MNVDGSYGQTLTEGLRRSQITSARRGNFQAEDKVKKGTFVPANN
jgi:hypothetical protein